MYQLYEEFIKKWNYKSKLFHIPKKSIKEEIQGFLMFIQSFSFKEISLVRLSRKKIFFSAGFFILILS